MARLVGRKGPSPQTSPKRARKHLSADALYGVLLARFERFHDARGDGVSLSLADVALSALAMFLLKDPSLLAFDARRHDRNMKNVFGIQRVPSDTQMREVLDELNPLQMRAAFNDVFRQLQRGKVLESLHSSTRFHTRLKLGQYNAFIGWVDLAKRNKMRIDQPGQQPGFLHSMSSTRGNRHCHFRPRSEPDSRLPCA